MKAIFVEVSFVSVLTVVLDEAKLEVVKAKEVFRNAHQQLICQTQSSERLQMAHGLGTF